MEKRRFSLIILLLLCCLSQMQAQWNEPPGQYWTVKGYLNPSFAGEEDAIRTTALYRHQWVGVQDAPRQLFLTADLPFEFFGKRHGAGLVVNAESTGQLRNTLLAAQYSFKKEIGTGFLNFGLQGGMYDLRFDAGSKHTITDSLQTGRGILKVNPADKQVFDLNAGISWTGKSGFVGLSAMHINQPRFYTHTDSLSVDLQNDSIRSFIPRTYNLTAGYNITLFYPLEIQPMVWLQTDLNKVEMQATLRLEYNKKFSGGASWKMNDGYLLFAGTSIRGIELGYAFGVHTGGVGQFSRENGQFSKENGPFSKGTHEIYLRYSFPLDYFKPKQQPHKSIRLL